MNLRDLKYLVTVAENLHFGKAAEICNVTQPALSIQLQKLESFLGVKIFERNNKRVIITEVGKEIISGAKKILWEVEEIKCLAKSYHSPFFGNFKLGAFPTLAPYLFPKIVNVFIQEYESLNLFLVEEKTNMLITKLINGKIDAALLALPLQFEFTSLETIELFSDEFFFATSHKSKFAKKKYLHVNDLKEEKLFLLEEGHCLRDQALDFCAKTGSCENHSFRATSLETLKQMVALGIGNTIIPELAKKENDNIVYIPFKSNAPFRKIGLVWRKTTARKKLIEEIIDKIKMFF